MRMKSLMVCLLIVLPAGSAYPQKKEILQLQSDMISLKQTINQLQTSVDQQNLVIKGLVEKIADQVNTLAAGMQKINTQDEKSASEFRTILTTLNTHVNDLQENLSILRGQVNSVSQQITTMKTTSEPLAGPDDLWRSAQVDNFSGNYDLATSGYKEFISKYPDDPRAADAQLGIADALYSQKKYDQAVTDYDLFLQKYQSHDKTRAALFKKGLAIAELNQPQQAIVILQQVVKEFPGTSEATSAASKIRDLQVASRRPR